MSIALFVGLALFFVPTLLKSQVMLLLLQSALNNLPDNINILVKDEDFTWVFANDHAAKNCGFKNSTDAIGKNDYDTWATYQQIDKFRQSDIDAFASNEIQQLIETQTQADGKHYLQGAKKSFNFGGKRYLAVSWIDVTELVNAKNAADLAREIMSSDMRSFSHDTKNAIVGILSMAFLLRKKMLAHVEQTGMAEDCKQCLEYVNQIEQSGNRLLAINQSMRESRELRKIQAVPTLVNSILDAIEQDWPNATVNRPKGDITVYTDISKLAINVFGNVLENAYKFAGEDSEVVVSVTETENEVDFHVSDNGPGIPPGKEKIIFSQGYGSRLDSSKPGSGIGLNQAKSTIGAMNGSIWVTNNEQSGCTFHFSVPKC